MELISVSIPFSPDDIRSIVSMLRVSDPLVGAPSNIRDLYDIQEFVINGIREKVALRVQVDNNVVSTATMLANGGCISNKESEARAERTTAALMAFLIISGFTLEPNVALYEQAWRSNHAHSLAQLELFRIADHVQPQAYIDIALGRVDRFEERTIDAARTLIAEKAIANSSADFRHVLRNWRVSYCVLLKVIEIERGGGSHLSNAFSLIDWMANDHFFSLVPTAMGLIYLSPRRLGGLIKSASSDNSEKVSSGLQNASWDCVYLRQWAGKARNSGSDEIWFFSSMDSHARTIARMLMTAVENSDEQFRLRALSTYWSRIEAEAISKHEGSQRARLDECRDDRSLRVQERLKGLNSLIREFETRLGLPHARLSEN